MRLDDMNIKAITKRRRSVSQQIKVRQVLAICSMSQNDSTTFTITVVQCSGYLDGEGLAAQVWTPRLLSYEHLPHSNTVC